jgi:ribosomal protein L12E/L44/L45/RPP1/RPP2
MMMMSPSPVPPKQSDFYNIVCNGTWLNRSQFSQAQADFRQTDTVFQNQQLAHQNKDWFQQQTRVGANSPLATAFTNATARLPLLMMPQVSPFVDEARGFYAKLAANIEQIRINLSVALMKTVELPKIMTQGFMALFAVAFLSGKKEATTTTGRSKTEEQEAIMKEADDQREQPKLFNQNVVKASTGGSGMGAQ